MVRIEPKSRWDVVFKDKVFVSGVLIIISGLIFYYLYLVEEESASSSQSLGNVVFGLVLLADAVALGIVGLVLLLVGALMGTEVPAMTRERLLKPGDVVSIGGVQARVQKVRGSSVKVNGIWISTKQIEFEKRDRGN